MGVKSRTRAEKRKEMKKDLAIARLRNVPTSPRKTRLVADLIRGKRVELALHILKTNPKHPAVRLHKLLLSAIANWQTKHEGERIEEHDLYVKEIMVDVGRTLKRIQPAPQGRAYRIRKRSNHVTIILDSMNKPEDIADNSEEISADIQDKPAEKKKVKAEKKKPAVKAKTGNKPKKATASKKEKAATNEKKVTKPNKKD